MGQLQNFELNEDAKLNKNHVRFVADETTDQQHVEESHMEDALKNLTNAIKYYAFNPTNLTTTNAKM